MTDKPDIIGIVKELQEHGSQANDPDVDTICQALLIAVEALEEIRREEIDCPSCISSERAQKALSRINAL